MADDNKEGRLPCKRCWTIGFPAVACRMSSPRRWEEREQGAQLVCSYRTPTSRSHSSLYSLLLRECLRNDTAWQTLNDHCRRAALSCSQCRISCLSTCYTRSPWTAHHRRQDMDVAAIDLAHSSDLRNILFQPRPASKTVSPSMRCMCLAGLHCAS